MTQKSQKRVPERKCIGCNEKKAKSELVRVVRTPEGEVKLDTKGKLSGRGVYTCKSAKCLEKAIKSGRIEKNLEVKVPDGFYESIREYLSEVEDL